MQKSVPSTIIFQVRRGLHANVTRSIGRSPQQSLLKRASPFSAPLRSLFIATENTPNPNGLKFMPAGESVLPPEYGASKDFRNLAQAQTSPLARRLFAAPGVKGVFFGPTFITITKDEETKWELLKLDVFSIVMDFYAEGGTIMADSADQEEDNLLIKDDDSEVVAMIKELLETRIRPAVQEDGGDILFRGFNETSGLVELQMAGSCAGCPSSTVTLKHGVENMLMHYIPEVKGVMQIEDDDDATHLTW